MHNSLVFLLFSAIIHLGSSQLVYQSGDYQLVYTDKNSGVPKDLQDRLIQVYFNAYPKMVQFFNTNAPKRVSLVLDPAAGTSSSNGGITLDANYIKNNPKDLDLLTFVLTYVVQAYQGNTPNWFVQGIAAFSRNKFGVANADAGWSLQYPQDNQNYDSSYLVTGGFLDWLEKQYPGSVQKFDSVLRSGKYDNNNNTWKQITGKTVEEQWAIYKAIPKPTTVVYQSGDYQLVVYDKVSGVPKDTIDRLIMTFFTVYPKLVQEYNSNALKRVGLNIDPDYNGVAFAANGAINISATYFKNNPKDVDVMTHEGMHIVQAYGSNAPGWMTEGIADFARNKFGVANADVGWKLTPPTSSDNYDKGYVVTAAFLVWVEKQRPGAVKQFDSILRSGNYANNDTWKQITGQTVEQQWSAYKASSNSG